jgi:hypothetical protein
VATHHFSPRYEILFSNFRKGIKRDPASFTVLKDNKQWDSVHWTLKAQTCYQDVDDVLNPCYAPNTAKDIALFDEKQKYMYSVLEQILQTDEGKGHCPFSRCRPQCTIDLRRVPPSHDAVYRSNDGFG